MGVHEAVKWLLTPLMREEAMESFLKTIVLIIDESLKGIFGNGNCDERGVVEKKMWEYMTL